MEIFIANILILVIIVGVCSVFKNVVSFVALILKTLILSKEPESNRKHKKPESDKYLDSISEEVKVFKKAANEFGFNTNKHPIIISKNYLKSLYREKAKKVHPDHGGSKEEFIRVKQAYDILSSRAI